MKHFIILSVVALVLSGCWSIAPELQKSQATEPKHDGIWKGHFDINGRGNFKFDALYIGNELIALSPDARVSYRGTVQFPGDKYHSNMDMYLLTNGSHFDSVMLAGNIVLPGEVEAQFLTQDGGDKGTLRLKQDKDLYDKGAHINKIADQWIYYHGFTITKFTIEQNGRIDGADTNGCGYEGEISVIDEKYNAYRVNLLLNSCHELDGVYQGMAYLFGSVEDDDTLNIQVYKEKQALYLPIVRDRKSSIRSSPKPTKPPL